MSGALERDTLFVALTRPQMFAGVPYSYFVANLIVATELFLVFRSSAVLLAAGVLHVAGAGLSIREPRFFEIWLARVSHCPRIKNYRMWGCNSYRP